MTRLALTVAALALICAAAQAQTSGDTYDWGQSQVTKAYRGAATQDVRRAPDSEPGYVQRRLDAARKAPAKPANADQETNAATAGAASRAQLSDLRSSSTSGRQKSSRP